MECIRTWYLQAAQPGENQRTSDYMDHVKEDEDFELEYLYEDKDSETID